MGLVGVVRSHVRSLYAILFNENTAPFYEHIGRWPDKTVELFFFFAGAVLLLLYSLALYFAWNRLKANQSAKSSWHRTSIVAEDWAGFLLLCALNLTIGFNYWREWFGETGNAIGDLIWILLIVFPMVLPWLSLKFPKSSDGILPANLPGMRKIYLLFIVVAFLQFASLIWPFLSNRCK